MKATELRNMSVEQLNEKLAELKEVKKSPLPIADQR